MLKTHVKRINFARSRKLPEEIIAQLINERFSENNKNTLIAIGGAGGSGKSTFSKKLSSLLNNSPILRLDDYKTPRSVRAEKKLFGAHPKANRMELIIDHLDKIKNGQRFSQPVYNAVTGKADSTKEFVPKKINIIDGEISCYKELRKFNSLNIFIDSDWKTQLKTRISRDIEIRKYSKEKAIETFLQSNLKEFTKYGADSKLAADIIIYCNEDYGLRIESVSEELFKKFNNILENDLSKVDLAGLIVPITTPFNKDFSINRRMFIEHMNYLTKNNVRRILISGTSSEFPSLRTKEKKLLLKLAKEYFPGVVLFQTGNSCLEKAIEDSELAISFGVDAVVSLPPYYYANIGDEGIIKYFNSLSSTVEIPFILYNFPLHTQNPINKEILNRVDHFGLKDSSGSLNLIENTNHYYAGKDQVIYDSMLKGGYGFIIGNANVFPKVYSKLEDSFSEKDFISAKLIQNKINEISEYFSEKNKLSKIKAALNFVLEDYNPHMRLPLLDTELTQEEKHFIQYTVSNI